MTWIIVWFWCYIMHYLSHCKNLECIGFIHLFHHDPSYKDSTIFFIIEMFLDIFIYGGFILIFIGEIIRKIFSIKLFNNYILFFWAILFSSYHIINLHYLNSPTHKDHHVHNGMLNYGPDWIDIICGTKLNNSEFEDFKSSIINSICTLVIIMILFKTYDPIKYIENFSLKTESIPDA